MSVTVILVGGLGAALIGTNLFWRRRIRAVENGFTVLQEWEAKKGNHGCGEVESDELLALQEAAKLAGVPPQGLPERIEKYDEQVRQREHEIKQLQDAWVDSWWDAATRRVVPTDGPRIVTLRINTGGRAVVREFAIHAMESEDEMVVAFDAGNGTFAVGASENVAPIASADEVAEQIANNAGGGAGGSEQLATGGGAAPEAIGEAIDMVAADVEHRLEDALASSVHVTTQGRVIG